jgi:biotin transporter BioY
VMVLSALSPNSDSKWAPGEKLALIAMVVALSMILASAQRQLAVNGVQWVPQHGRVLAAGEMTGLKPNSSPP